MSLSPLSDFDRNNFGNHHLLLSNVHGIPVSSLDNPLVSQLTAELSRGNRATQVISSQTCFTIALAL